MPASRRNDQSHRAILTAAAELVTELGYRKLSIEAIAARAGVGKQTIYRWWPSKGAVVLDAFMVEQQDSGGTAIPETSDLGADLQLLLRGTVAQLADPRFDAPYRALTTEMQHDSELAHDVLTRLLGPLMQATRDRIERGRASGQVAANTDPIIATELLFGPVFHRWLLRTAPLDEAFADALCAHVRRAIAQN